MNSIFGDESDSDRFTEREDSSQENSSNLAEKYTGAKRSKGWGNNLSVEEESYKIRVFMVMNQKLGNKCTYFDIDKPGNKGKFDISVIADGIVVLLSPSIGE